MQTIAYDALVADTRRCPKAMAVGMRDAVTLWRDRMLPKHYRTGATTTYGYASRTRKYNDRKFKKFGHRVPLVWSGDSRRQILDRSGVAKISKTPSGYDAKMRLNAPSYIYAYRPMSQYDKADEILRTTPEEENEIIMTAVDSFDANMNAEIERNERFF